MIRVTWEKRPKRRKKVEFSKKWLISCIVLSVIFTATSYVLAAFDKNPVSELSAAVLDVMWGAAGVSFLGYAVQNCARAYTSSKYGIPEEKKEDKENGN